MIRGFYGAHTQSLESKAPGHASTHGGNFDWIQRGRGPRTSHSHSRYPKCAFAWATRHVGAPQRRSAFDIVGHLIVGERTDWIPRLRIILEKGEARQFDPVDRLAQFDESQGKSLDQLLDDFASLRRENLAALQTLNLQHEDWTRRGKHPSLGVVTLSELVATWAVHDLTHIHQLSRVMAHQYRNAVGPWSAYLGVLKCAGHSA